MRAIDRELYEVVVYKQIEEFTGEPVNPEIFRALNKMSDSTLESLHDALVELISLDGPGFASDMIN